MRTPSRTFDCESAKKSAILLFVGCWLPLKCSTPYSFYKVKNFRRGIRSPILERGVRSPIQYRNGRGMNYCRKFFGLFFWKNWILMHFLGPLFWNFGILYKRLVSHGGPQHWRTLGFIIQKMLVHHRLEMFMASVESHPPPNNVLRGLPRRSATSADARSH